MSIFRIARRSHFTTIPNATLRDNRLSLKSKGLLALMLSFPDNWNFTMAHIESQSTDGRDAHRSAMRELKKAGYIVRKPKRDSGGKVQGWEYIVSDTSSTERRETRPTVNPSDGKSPPTKNEVHEELEDQTPSSPAATPSTSSSSREKVTREQIEKVVGVWNEHCGTLPSVKSVNNARARKVRSMVKQLGFDEAMRVMEQATKNVASDDFWLSKKYGLDNLLAGEKYVQKAETYEAENGSNVDEVEVGAHVIFENRKGMMTERLRGTILDTIYHPEDQRMQFIVGTDDGSQYRMSYNYIREVLE